MKRWKNLLKNIEGEFVFQYFEQPVKEYPSDFISFRMHRELTQKQIQGVDSRMIKHNL